MDGRSFDPKGKVLGGSSSINGMIYAVETQKILITGARGAHGWSYSDVSTSNVWSIGLLLRNICYEDCPLDTAGPI